MIRIRAIRARAFRTRAMPIPAQLTSGRKPGGDPSGDDPSGDVPGRRPAPPFLSRDLPPDRRRAALRGHGRPIGPAHSFPPLVPRRLRAGRSPLRDSPHHSADHPVNRPADRPVDHPPEHRAEAERALHRSRSSRVSRRRLSGGWARFPARAAAVPRTPETPRRSRESASRARRTAPVLPGRATRRGLRDGLPGPRFPGRVIPGLPPEHPGRKRVEHGSAGGDRDANQDEDGGANRQ